MCWYNGSGYPNRCGSLTERGNKSRCGYKKRTKELFLLNIIVLMKNEEKKNVFKSFGGIQPFIAKNFFANPALRIINYES